MIKVWVDQVVVVRVGRMIKGWVDQVVVDLGRRAVRTVRCIHLLAALMFVSGGCANSQQPAPFAGRGLCPGHRLASVPFAGRVGYNPLSPRP